MTAILLLRIRCSTNNRRALRFLRHPSIALFTLMNCEEQLFPELSDAYQQCCSFQIKSICKNAQVKTLFWSRGFGESPNKRKCGWVAPRHCLPLWNQKISSTAVVAICHDLNMVIWNANVIEKGILFLGGHPNMTKKLRQQFPKWTFVSDDQL